MPLPIEYQRASDHLYSFLTELRDLSNFGSSHQSYTTTQGVFQVFRNRLTVDQAIVFANALPTALRALFVADWDTKSLIKPFVDIASMNEEVKQLRPQHNFSSASAIQNVGTVLRRHVDIQMFKAALSDFPLEAKAFWYYGEEKISKPTPKGKAICLCGSMHFIDEMESLGVALENAGFTVMVPKREGTQIDWGSLPITQSSKMKQNYIDKHLEKIRQADLVLIANYTKQNTPGYIGANTLIEAAFAYAFDVPIAYLEKPGKQGCQLEALAMSGLILGNDVVESLSKAEFFTN